MVKLAYSRSALFALISLAILERSSAQMIGVDICACLPTIVTFRLNFTFDCDGSNVAGLGINDTTCLIETRGNQNVTDYVPTSISTVQVFELNEDREVVGDSTYDEGYFDGSEITYTSIVERDPDSVLSLTTLPRGFQILLTGVNALEQTIVNVLAIEYTGECGIFPLLEVGEQIGWILFTDLGDPSEQFCPNSSTSPPLIPPTVAPLPLLSEMPSDSPTISNDSEIPSASPVVSPTDIAAPACPPIDTGGKSGIVNGESGVADKYKNASSDKRSKVDKATEDMDRHLRTGGGGVECPEPIQPDTTTKKVMTKDGVEKSPKEDVMKGSKGQKKKESPTKKSDDDKSTGKMDVSKKASDSEKKSSNKVSHTGKGANSTSVAKGKHEEGMNATRHNITLPKHNVTGGKGKGYSHSGAGPSKSPMKESKSSTEDDEERNRSRSRQL